MNLRFTITGNQENAAGNPIPYHRTTQRAKFTPAHQRYLAWKDHVRGAFQKSADMPKDYEGREMVYDKLGGRPSGRVSAMILFGGENHADPDNVIKGILDALFDDDKEIDVETWHTCGNADPRVEVTIELL